MISSPKVDGSYFWASEVTEKDRSHVKTSAHNSWSSGVCLTSRTRAGQSRNHAPPPLTTVLAGGFAELTGVHSIHFRHARVGTCNVCSLHQELYAPPADLDKAMRAIHTPHGHRHITNM